MMYDFDEIINRKNTDSIKYDFSEHFGMPEDILPLWVADMDFRTPPAVSEALAAKSLHGIYGYSDTRGDYFDILKQWFGRQFGWEIQPSWLVKTPGIVYAICTAVRSLTEKGEAVLIQEPVYSPYRQSVLMNGRELAVNQLIYEDGKYRIDFEDFEKKIVERKVKMFLLCSPHNPIGRVWTQDELIRMGTICHRNGVIVLSDEIHADFIFPGFKHHVFAGLMPEFADISITCTAPSKTFNLAGLHISNVFISNPALRKKFQGEMRMEGIGSPNIMGITACKAAYAGGGPWLEDLREYLTGNLQMVRDYLALHIPQVKLVEPGGTYLLWLDFRALSLTDDALNDFIVHKAGLWLDHGPIFGQGGSGFQRVNIACPRAVLAGGLDRLAAAVRQREDVTE